MGIIAIDRYNKALSENLKALFFRVATSLPDIQQVISAYFSTLNL